MQNVVLTEEEEQRLKDLFDQYDEDGSGHITEDELYTILNEILHNKATAIHIVHVIFLNTFHCSLSKIRRISPYS